MGASNIDFEVKGKASRKEIQDAFKSRKEYDRQENARQYGGGFETINTVNLDHLTKNGSDYVFADYNTAYDYALDNAEKWDYAVAVYYTKEDNTIGTIVAGWGAS